MNCSLIKHVAIIGSIDEDVYTFKIRHQKPDQRILYRKKRFQRLLYLQFLLPRRKIVLAFCPNNIAACFLKNNLSNSKFRLNTSPRNDTDL